MLLLLESFTHYFYRFLFYLCFYRFFGQYFLWTNIYLPTNICTHTSDLLCVFLEVCVCICVVCLPLIVVCVCAKLECESYWCLHFILFLNTCQKWLVDFVFLKFSILFTLIKNCCCFSRQIHSWTRLLMVFVMWFYLQYTWLHDITSCALQVKSSSVKTGRDYHYGAGSRSVSLFPPNNSFIYIFKKANFTEITLEWSRDFKWWFVVFRINIIKKQFWLEYCFFLSEVFLSLTFYLFL